MWCGTSQTNVITYDTTSGQLFYTASSAVGGGSINTGSLGNTTISGSLTVTGSTTLIGNTTVSGSKIIAETIIDDLVKIIEIEKLF